MKDKGALFFLGGGCNGDDPKAATTRRETDVNKIEKKQT